MMGEYDPRFISENFAALVVYFRRHLPPRLRPDAEDLAQEVLAATWQAVQDESKEVGDLVRFLRAVARHKCADALRSHRRRQHVSLDQSVEELTARLIESAVAEYRLIQAERARRLAEALKSLPENESRMLHLRYFEDLDNDGASRSLGIDPAVGSRLRWVALKKLRTLLEEDPPGRRPQRLRAIP